MPVIVERHAGAGLMRCWIAWCRIYGEGYGQLLELSSQFHPCLGLQGDSYMPEQTEIPEETPSEMQKAIWTTPHTTHLDMAQTLNTPGSGGDGVIAMGIPG